MKKVMCIIMMLSMLVTIFVGCGKSDKGETSNQEISTGNESEKNIEKGNEELTEISVMLFDRGNVPKGEGTVDNNRWTTYINEEMEKLGIHVNFILVPRSEESSKIPVMMASGTAADIMLTYNSSIVERWYLEGGIYDISAELEEYGHDIIDYIGEDVLSYGIAEDGGQFAIPARRSITASYNAFIRKDWLDKLGMEIPTTPDELYTVLKAFKEEDPGDVGADRVKPLGYTPEVLANLAFSFITYEDNETYKANNIELPSGDEVGYIYTDSGFKGYFEFLNNAYNDGLMDPEFFTSKSGQKEKEAFVDGSLGYWETNVGGNVDTLRGGLLQNLRAIVPEADMVAVSPFENVNDGKQYINEYVPTGGYVFIPKTAKNIEACIKYLNFLSGEGGKTLWFGYEGINYEMIDNIPAPIDVELNAKQLDWLHHDVLLVGNQGYFRTEEAFIQTTAKMLPDYEQYLIDDYTKALEGHRLSGSGYKSPTESEQSGNLDKVNADYKIKLITCDSNDFDKVYNEYKEELKKYKIDVIISERTAYFSK